MINVERDAAMMMVMTVISKDVKCDVMTVIHDELTTTSQKHLFCLAVDGETGVKWLRVINLTSVSTVNAITAPHSPKKHSE